MHELSYDEMKKFVIWYLDAKKSIPLKIVDIGSLDVNGTYKPLFDNPLWEYKGVDIVSGANVDVITTDPYFYPFEDDTFDVVISGSCMEHVEDIYAFIKEAARILKAGGIMCIIVPWIWSEHKHPVDCWRVLPDGMKFLMEKIAGLNILQIHKNTSDCIGVATKHYPAIVH